MFLSAVWTLILTAPIHCRDTDAANHRTVTFGWTLPLMPVYLLIADYKTNCFLCSFSNRGCQPDDDVTHRSACMWDYSRCFCSVHMHRCEPRVSPDGGVVLGEAFGETPVSLTTSSIPFTQQHQGWEEKKKKRGDRNRERWGGGVQWVITRAGEWCIKKSDTAKLITGFFNLYFTRQVNP